MSSIPMYGRAWGKNTRHLSAKSISPDTWSTLDSWLRRDQTRSSCTTCLRTAVRKLRMKLSMAPSPWCSTKPRTGFTRRKRCLPSFWAMRTLPDGNLGLDSGRAGPLPAGEYYRHPRHRGVDIPGAVAPQGHDSHVVASRYCDGRGRGGHPRAASESYGARLADPLLVTGHIYRDSHHLSVGDPAIPRAAGANEPVAMAR